MTNSIVTVDVTQTIAPTPPTLQSSGALISQGATTLASGTYSYLTQLADLTPLLSGALAVTSITQTSGLATVTTSAPHGLTLSDVIEITIAGSTILAYNGTFACTITGASAFTYAIASGTASPATGTITYTLADVAELLSMATTFFAQGSNQGVYVLELGEGNAAAGIVALQTYITANPNSAYTPGSDGFFYSYLLPREWTADSTLPAFLANYESTTAQTYFFITATTGNYTDFTTLEKPAFVLVEAPGKPATEFSLAAVFYWSLNFRPSPTNKVAPFAFIFLFGVTPYKPAGNAAQLAAFKAANVNYVGTGAQGGISTACLFWGTTKDGRPFTYWYSIDALQIYSTINIANEIINGSNNPANPLYYNQDGINRLSAVEASTLVSLVSWGLALGQVVQTSLDSDDLVAAINAGAFNGKIFVNCIPFIDYLTTNPDDYKIGEYDGMTAGYIAQNGFIHILFTVNVTDFVVQ